MNQPLVPVSLESIRAPIAADLAALDEVIRRRLDSEVVLVRTIADYIIAAGGKRLRPALLLLTANALGAQGPSRHELAAVIEFIHTATLLHDDVVDESSLRRGRRTANAEFGNAAAVLVGDFLHSRAFQMMVAEGNLRVMQVISNATNVIAEGEVMYRAARAAPVRDAERHLDIVRRRRAKLFEAGAQCMAILHRATPEVCEAFARFGLHVGMAHALRTEAEDGVKFGIDDAGARAARELEAARAVVAALETEAVAQPERLAPFM